MEPLSAWLHLCLDLEEPSIPTTDERPECKARADEWRRQLEQVERLSDESGDHCTHGNSMGLSAKKRLSDSREQCELWCQQTDPDRTEKDAGTAVE